MIDRFDVRRFESALPKDKDGEIMWQYEGMISGERVYSIKIRDWSRIKIRSSIDESGYAADTGEDSIRLWAEILTDSGDWKPLPKIDAYTTRVNGWEGRMIAKMRELWALAIKIKRPVPRCESCGKTQAVWQVGKGPNQGRWASKCIDCEKGFTWMDETWQKAEPKESDALPVSEKSEQPTSASSDVEFGSAETATASTSSSQESTTSSQATSEGDFLSELNQLANEAFNGTHKMAKVDQRGQANEQQLRAINAPLDAAIRVLASPGSGKTFCIERRYAYLLANGVSPKNIVAVTFSAAMAQDLQARILKHNKEVSGTGAENQICTIHALCNRICQAEGVGKQVPKTWQMKKMVQDIVAEQWEYSTNANYVRPNWDEVLRAFANAKGNGFAPGHDADFYERLWGEYHAERLTRARVQFDSSMQAQGFWTFNDMLYEAEKLLVQNREVREKYQARYQYIIIDEGQDTNHQAMRILTLLAAPQNRLFIVGDPDQLLFRFTGATPEDNLYDGFTKRYPDGLMFMLETNYRSTHKIVERSNELIAKNYVGEGGPYNEVFHKIVNARPDANTGKDVSYMAYEDPLDEANQVAEQIKLMIDEGRAPGEFFVGTRTRAQLGYLEGPLTRLGVKFINITGGSFWQQSHVANTIAYLRLVVNPKDSESFQRIYNIASAKMMNKDREYCPTRYLGRAFLEEVGNEFDRRRMTAAANTRYAWMNGVRDLFWLMDEIEAALQTSVGSAIRAIMDKCMIPYLKHEEGVAEDDSESGKIADLETIIDVAKHYKSAKDFLDRIDEMIEAAKAAKEKKWDDYVVLSTIHRLKGMERNVVFGLGWCEGQYVTHDGHHMKIGLLPHTFSLMPPPTTGVLDIASQSLVEDERCMAFVLVTRAKEEVYLSGVLEYRGIPMYASRFVQEMGLLQRAESV